MPFARRMARWAYDVRAWALWTLPKWLVGLILLAVVGAAAATGVAAATFQVRSHDLILFALLSSCVVVTVELTRQEGERKGLVKDVYSAWGLPAAILLPPVYVLVMTVIYYSCLQWRVRKAPPHKRTYSAAIVGLSFVAAGMVFRWLRGTAPLSAPHGTTGQVAWCLALIAAVLVYSAVNKVFMIAAIKGSDPTADIRTSFFSREPLYNDMAEQCIGALVTYGVASNIFLVPIALPVVALLQRSLRHAQLLNDSRTDAKTGLLNARAWESEAEAEVARAVRARMALAVAVLDIDWFKRVNDTYGHLFGDEVLKEIARCLPGVLREYDAAGRFGGEEFVLLLPHTRAVDAFRIADRVRDHISGLSLHTTDGQAVQVTVSVGVAALDAGARRELSELLAAADAALYRAKRDGRNQVQMISTTRGLSAVGGQTVSINGIGGVPAAPSAWDVLPVGNPHPAGDTDEIATKV
ncbi:MAG: GGDEF domain-containing protein [Streptosporangiaceae bacterium]|jgi:diguanylate cyclase (GGDEF)-like protein